MNTHINYVFYWALLNTCWKLSIADEQVRTYILFIILFMQSVNLYRSKEFLIPTTSFFVPPSSKIPAVVHSMLRKHSYCHDLAEKTICRVLLRWLCGHMSFRLQQVFGTKLTHEKNMFFFLLSFPPSFSSPDRLRFTIWYSFSWRELLKRCSASTVGVPSIGVWSFLRTTQSEWAFFM